MGLFDLPDDAKERLDAMALTMSNIATGLKDLVVEIRKHREVMEELVEQGKPLNSGPN